MIKPWERFCSELGGLFIDGCSTRCPKNTARLKILHSGQIDQDLVVIIFCTFIDLRKNVKQNENLGEDTHEVEIHENICGNYSIF